ncbi:MAG: hypothetical protein HY517_01690 [Candidatus Aenigmarchaeota archaeon]|nr:hypothetical protein [Candidatus Aenigmarchaeota archaeon]
MGKIQDYISKQNIKPKECGYHTWRDAKNKKGQPTGKIRVLVPPASTTAMVEYTCPECRHVGYAEQPWKRPFSISCEKCRFKITVPKMKDAAKKEAKAENAKD